MTFLQALRDGKPIRATNMNFELSGVDSDTQDSISFDWGGGTALGNQRAEVYVHAQAADEPGCPWVQIPPRKRLGSAPCCNGSISGCNSRLSSSLGKEGGQP